MSGPGIEVTNDEEVIRKLDGDVLYAKPLKDYFNTLVFAGQNAARQHAKPHGGDTGTLARSISTRIDPAPTPMWGEVYTDLSYARSADQGRAPGKPPPSDVMEDFARRHGLPEGLGFVLARAIGRKGTKGLHFMDRGVDAINAKGASAAASLAAAVEKIWGAGK